MTPILTKKQIHGGLMQNFTEDQLRILRFFKKQYMIHGREYPPIRCMDQVKNDITNMFGEDMYYTSSCVINERVYFFGENWGDLYGKEMFTYIFREGVGNNSNRIPDHLIDLFDKI